MPRHHRPLPALLAVGVLALAGCASPAGSDSGKFTIVTDLYPTTFAVEQVVGDNPDVEIVQLAPPGVEPHEYELTPQQVKQIAQADLVAYLPEMIPAVEKAVEQEAAGKAVDVAAGVDLIEEDGHSPEEGHSEEEGDHGHAADPHIWLDPRNVAVMGQNVAKALQERGVQVDDSGLRSEMTGLYNEMASALGSCQVKTLVTAHEAFGYLAAAFGFEQVGITGLSPESQPSPAKLAEIAQLVKGQGVTTIYFEELLPADAAKTIAAETGARTALLDPIEGNTDDKGYVAIMKQNTGALVEGQSCS